MAPARFLQQGWRLHRPCQRTAPVSIFCCFFGLYDNVTMHSPALQENGVPMPSHEPGVGIPVQKYLQSHFINAMKKVAEVLKDEPNVVGFDTLNEPSNGWVGYEELDKELLPFRFGALMTPWQAMQLGSGHGQDIQFYSKPFVYSHSTFINQTRTPVWRQGTQCVWKQNGVWAEENGRPVLLRPHHFAWRPAREGDVGAGPLGMPIDFLQDYMVPFFREFTKGIRSVMPHAVIFAEPHCNMVDPDFEPICRMGPEKDFVFAPHYYDVMTLVTKQFRRWVTMDSLKKRPVFGYRAVLKAHALTLQSLKEGGIGFYAQPGRLATREDQCVPTFFGEIGIPMDMGRGPSSGDDAPRPTPQAYLTGDFRQQVDALDANMVALESNLASFTLWCYTPDNTNKRGDLWNDEDLSVFSPDQQFDPEDVHSGGRALPALIRPYARKIAGTPLRMAFWCQAQQRTFEFAFRHDPKITEPTEIFVPQYQYPGGYQVEVSDGTYKVLFDQQILLYYHTKDKEDHRLRIWKQ